MTHPALDESELYDEPRPFLVSPIHPEIVAAGAATVAQEPPTKPTGPKPKDDAYLNVIRAAFDILSYRVILLLSVLVAGALFGLATWNPDPWRLGAAAAFAVIVVVPLTFFYARR